MTDLLPTQRSIDALFTGSVATLARVVIWRNRVATTDTLPVTAGRVSVEEGRSPARTVDLTVAGLSDWVPRTAADALDPRSGVEFALQSGIVDDAGAEHWYDLGLFTPTNPKVTDSTSGLSITCSGLDRSATVKAALMTDRAYFPAGMPVGRAIRSLLATKAPWLPLDIPDTDFVLPSTTMAGVIVGADPWAEATRIAAAAGLALRVDVDGVARTRPITDPLVGTPAATWVEGAGGALLSVDRELVTGDLVNGAICQWQYAGWFNGVEVVWDETSPSSRGRIGERPFVVDVDPTTIGDAEQARAVAAAELLTRQGLVEQVQVSVLTDPRRDVGEAVTLRRVTAGVDAVYRVTALDIPLGGDAMTVTLGARRIVT